MTKYVSLTEALKSGKNFRILRDNGKLSIEVFNRQTIAMFDADDIVTAQCIIEREPREIWIVQNLDGKTYPMFFDNKELALRYYDYEKEKLKPIKFREVIE